MTSSRFFIRKASLEGDVVELEGREHHHLSRVARVEAGDRVQLFDEEGTDYDAEVEDVGERGTRLRVLGRKSGDQPRLPVVLAQAMLKSKAMELVIQKGTEIGLAAIVPVTAERSVARVEDKADRKVERWQAIAREAAKQCKNGFPPRISRPCSLEEAVGQDLDGRRFYLSETEGRDLGEVLRAGPEGGLRSPVLLLVGPEGGWSRAEEEFMRLRGCEAVSLGKRVLRAETAALCAASAVILMWNG